MKSSLNFLIISILVTLLFALAFCWCYKTNQLERLENVSYDSLMKARGIRQGNKEIVFCDIHPQTFLIDLDRLETILKASPKGPKAI